MSSVTNSRSQKDSSANLIARVRVDVAVTHLDRDFDYRVPPEHQGSVQRGSRIRVRFSGRLRDAFVVDLGTSSDHPNPVSIERPIDVVPPLTDETLELVAETSKRYVGTFWDVARSAIPTRHKRGERSVLDSPLEVAGEFSTNFPDPWQQHQRPQALDRPRRVVWSSVPAASSEDEILDLILKNRREGKSVIVVLPDGVGVKRLLARAKGVIPSRDIAQLLAEQGAETRYREFLRIRTGRARTVVGNRTSVFAPAAELGAVILWDDGNDVYRERHAPYWDAREVAALRSHISGCDLFVGGPSRSVVTQSWIAAGWARSVEPLRPEWWRVHSIGDMEVREDPAAKAARIPTFAWRTAKQALLNGPVLFHVMRRGYIPALACQECRASAVCPDKNCLGILRVSSGHSGPTCARCGALAGSWSCPNCHGNRLRSLTAGAERTAEELGRAFPGVPVVWSQAEHRIEEIQPEPAVVVATPGAEPYVREGYQAVILLDSRVMQPSLAGGEDQVRRWFAASALVKRGGAICLVGDPALAEAQAVIRWDSRWYASRVLQERKVAGLPPAVRVAELTGPEDGLDEIVSRLTVPHRILGPVSVTEAGGGERARNFVLARRSDGRQLTEDLDAAQRWASAESGPGRQVRVRMDPRDM